MIFENNLWFDEKRGVPISQWANSAIDLKTSDLKFLMFFWFFCALIIISPFLYSYTKNVIVWIVWALVFLGSILFILIKIERITEGIKEKNLTDYNKALKILKVRDKFLAFPPNLLRVSDPRAIRESGWRPIRVDYHLDQKVSGEIKGKLSGSWAGLLFGGFSGTFEGELKGKSVPDLFNESTFILFQKGDQTMRLICPSVKTCQEISLQIFAGILGVYGFSHSGYAIRAMGWGTKIFWQKGEQASVMKLLGGNDINPSHIHDRLSASLNLPFEERSVVEVQGIPLKEGIILGCTIVIDNEPPKILFPIEFIQELSRHLAPIVGQELLPSGVAPGLLK
jgi:hypothetical protein